MVVPWLLMLLGASGQALAAGFSQVGTTGFISEATFPGIRSMGLGGADFAAPEGPGAIMLTPAVPLSGTTATISYAHCNWLVGQNVSQMAAAGEWRGFRLSMARFQNALHDLFRNAYDPGGTKIDAIQQIYTTGLSTEILPASWRDLGVSVVAGASWRHYRSELGSDKESADDADLGLTLRWRRESALGWVGVDLAAMRHNILKSTIGSDREEYNLPAYSQVGFALTGTLKPDQYAWELLRLMTAYAHRQEAREEDRLRFHDDRWGVELKVLETLAVRWGESDHAPYEGESTTRGLGLTIPRRLIDPVEVQLNWARIDGGIFEDNFDTYGATVSAWF
jgi:hypothetical protein